ncbi:DUF6304 family protein [Streptomyces chryseus]|uniref:DUF6304 family protein n=1 Tax=Streptomyces chryseus TaxID=68186 RepID=UPI00199B3F09|nr:DUF6304 family protein [Streptomyces chryseus]GGX05310.1 hypothetical protein GCM10010353_20890 [Streptomyces chryseus]
MTGEPWAGWYRDREGSVAVHFTTDGQRLRTRIRGVDFEGDSFDALDPVAGPPSQGAGFTLSDGSLCDCVLEWDIPVPVYADGRVHRATLSCLLALGKPLPNGAVDREHLSLTLHFDGAAYASERAESDFEHALTVIQRQLPSGAYLRACISCAFSDYHPVGTGMFGNLACFRRTKGAYRTVDSKQDLFDLWDLRSGFVQETWACPDFERRPAQGPGTGYRGPFPYARPQAAASSAGQPATETAGQQVS